jgi:hypothetical protein
MVVYQRKINKIRAWSRNLSEVKHQKNFDQVLKNFDKILQDEHADPNKDFVHSTSFQYCTCLHGPFC